MNKSTKSLNAVAYVRVSSEKQIDGYSLDAQTNILKKYAKSNNMKLLKIFREEGKSGRYKDNRPLYLEMLQFIKENPVDVVLSHKLDRMSRNDCDTLNDMNYITNELGVQYIAVGENMDSEDEDFALKMGIQAVINSQFSRNLSKETRKGLLAGAENCQHMGGKPPYGFKVNAENGLLEIDETTAPAVRQIYQLYADGFTASEICGWLDEHGYKTAKGNRFKANALNAILHNEKYRGCYTWDKAVPKNPDGHRNSHAVKEHYLKIEGGCPAIVSDELFAAAQERLAKNRDKASRAKSKHYYPLNGIIFCSQCGSRMTGNVQYSRGKPYYQYRCSKRCGSKAVNAKKLEKGILQTLSAILFSEPNRTAILDALNHFANDSKLENDTAYQRLKVKLSGLETRQSKLLEAVEYGKATTTIMNRLQQVSEEMEQVHFQIESLDRTVHLFNESDLDELQKQFVQYMRNNGTIQAKRLLTSTVNRVDVSDCQVQVTLADGISIDRSTKKSFNMKGTNTMNTQNLDAILTAVEEKTSDIVASSFVFRMNGELNYEHTLKLDFPYDVLFQIAREHERDFISLVGSSCSIDVETDESGKITRIVDFDVA